MAYRNGPKIVTDGLVLCLDAAISKSYPGSGNMWYDLSGQGNDTTIVGVAFDDENNGSFSFDGNDYINFNNTVSENISPIGSIELFIKTNSPSVSQEILFLTDNRDRAIFIEDGKYKAAAYNGSDSAYKVLIGTISNTLWTHCVFCYTQNNGVNSVYNFYINGTLVDQIIANITTDAPSDDSHNRLGTRYNSGIASQGLPARSSNFLGQCALCRFYNKILSANEVQQNYKATKGRFGL